MAIKTNKTKQELEQSIRVRRDALQNLHQKLKEDSDAYQKWIMGISTLSGGIEVGKLSLGAESPLMDLTSIFFASITTLLASLMRFQDYNNRLEQLVKSSAELTSVLKAIRDSPNVSIDMIEMYNKSLAIVETTLYPEQRKKYFKLAEAGVVSITKDELIFNKKIDKVEKTHAIEKTDIELGNSNEIIKYEED
jgi:hypothetical protein